MCSRTAQVDAGGCIEIARGGLCKEPGAAFAQAEERIARGVNRHRVHRPDGQAALGIGQRAPVRIQHDHPGGVPECVQCSGIVTQVVCAIQRTIDEGEGRRRLRHIVNELPQPQVVLALGLRMTNCAPVSDSV